MMWELLAQPFQFPFMLNAFYICILVAIPTALLSCFLVLKGWALMGDAVSHAVLPGIVLAYLFGIPLLIGAFLAGMLCAISTGYLADNSRIKQDTVMGVVFSGMFAFGIVLYVSSNISADLHHILFGNMLGIEAGDLWTAGIISALVTGAIAFKWRDLLLHSFDPAQAKTSGLSVNLLHYGLLSAMSLTIVATLSATGLILAIGLLIAPGAIAFLMTKRFSTMLIAAVILNLCTMLFGVYLSFHLDSAPAPTIILVQTVLFVILFANRLWQNRRASEKRITKSA